MKQWKYHIQEKYDYYDPDRPSVQRLFDIGTVMKNEVPVFIDSIQIIQNCLKEYEYKAMLQSLYEKQQEFLRYIMHVATTKQQQILCC